MSKHIQFIANPRAGMTYIVESASIKHQLVAMYSPFNEKSPSKDIHPLLVGDKKMVIKTHIHNLPNYNIFLKKNKLDKDIFFNILLLRQNITESILSYAIARRTQQWGWNDYLKKSRFSLAYSDIKQACNLYIQHLSMVQQEEYNQIVDKVFVYNNIPDGLADICSYLQNHNLVHTNFPVSNRTLNTKQAFKKSEVIDNYAESKQVCLDIIKDINISGIIITNGEIRSYDKK